MKLVTWVSEKSNQQFATKEEWQSMFLSWYVKIKF